MTPSNVDRRPVRQVVPAGTQPLRAVHLMGSRLRRWRGPLGLVAVLAASALLGAASAQAEDLVVRYRSEGPHAIESCVDGLTRRGEAFQGATRDHSDSLDELANRYGLGRQKAVFRPSGDRALESKRSKARAAMSTSGNTPRDNAARRPDLAHVYRVEVPEGVASEELIRAFSADPHVEYVQRDYVMNLDQAAAFDDPLLRSEGSWGQPHLDLWGAHHAGATEVWDEHQGEGIVVAVVDTGLDASHPDIARNVWVNPGEDLDGDGFATDADRNGIDDDGNGFIDDITGFDFANSIDADADGFYDGPDDVSDADPFDDNGHGTHVAGTIAAVGGNGIGIVGIAPRAKIMALKGFPATGSASASDLWRAVLYAAEQGASVVNTSWSCGTPCPVNPLAEDTLALVEALGTVVVTSAGNATDDVVFNNPENSARVLTVGAIGVDDEIPLFSNRGWLVDVVAPGGGPSSPRSVRVPRRNILSLLSSGTAETELAFAVGGDYLRFSGTSMSAPHVTGAVALLRGLRPELTPADVRRLIRLGSRDLGPPGHDALFGAGTLDIVRLVQTPLPSVVLSIESPRPASLHDPARGDLLFTGRAHGEDLADLEVSVSPGLSGHAFEPLEDFAGSVAAANGTSPGEAGILARWEVGAVPDGPYVVRFRATLRDGRNVDEYAVVGIERNRSHVLSNGELAATQPRIFERQIVWEVQESRDTPAIHDLVLGRFPSGRHSRSLGEEDGPVSGAVLELEGDQRRPQRAGGELVWRVPEGDSFVVERCRLERRTKGCAPAQVSPEGGPYGWYFASGEWLVWQRTSFVEGCRIPAGAGAGAEECTPRPLLAPSAEPGWGVVSFDGETMLLQNRFRAALCRLESIAGEPETCLPREITFSSGGAGLLEAQHSGPLLVGQRLRQEVVFPSDCEIGEPACIPELAFIVRLEACWVDEAAMICDPQQVGPPIRADSLFGVSISGRRIAWSEGLPSEKPAVFFCEFEPALRECVPQRVGGSVSYQTQPDLDGDRLVWEDGRAGVQQIHGLELPGLSAPALASVDAGTPLRLRLRARPGSSGSVRFELTGVDGLSPEQAKAELVEDPSAPGKLTIMARIPADAEGVARWRVRAISAGGLFSERVVTIEIRGAEEPKAPSA